MRILVRRFRCRACGKTVSINVNQIDVGIGQFLELLQIITAINDARIHQRGGSMAARRLSAVALANVEATADGFKSASCTTTRFVLVMPKIKRDKAARKEKRTSNENTVNVRGNSNIMRITRPVGHGF